VSDSVACPRCKFPMDEVVTIAPVGDEPGLIAYECPSCCYVTSVLTTQSAGGEISEVSVTPDGQATSSGTDLLACVFL